MARSRKSRRRRDRSRRSCRTTFTTTRARQPVALAGRRSKDPSTWTVTDDWPDEVPVTEAEIEVFEAWFGDLFDELFSTRH